MEEQLLRRADLVITSAERLRDNKVKVNPNTVLVRHGVDFDHFVKACDPATKIPEDIANLPRPVFGFFGLVADWVDLEAIAATARAHPEGSVVVIGKVAPDVDHVGAEGRAQHPPAGPQAATWSCRATAAAFDVALMPFNGRTSSRSTPTR